MSPDTEAGGVVFRDMILDGARINLGHDGHLVPMCLLLARRDPDTRRAFPAPRLVVVGLGLEMANEESKEAFARTIAEASVRTDALAAALVIEAWEVSDMTGETVARAMQHKARHGSLADFPGRNEVVRVTWEHVAMGVEQWTAPIVRDGAAVTCGDFARDAEGVWFGRFAHLLSTAAYGPTGTEA